MSEPAKGVWRIGTTDPLQTYASEAKAADQLDPRDPRLEVVAFVPVSARVVEMPTAPGEPPCVYVRGQRVLAWQVSGPFGVLHECETEQEARAAMAQASKSLPVGVPLALRCELVIETRTRGGPARE